MAYSVEAGLGWKLITWTIKKVNPMNDKTTQAQRLAHWHQLIGARDLAQLDTALAEDAVMHSPIVHHPLVGKTIVIKYLSAAFHVFLNDDFHYLRECLSDNSAILEFETTIDGIYVNGVDMIRWNQNGLIDDFKVMVRPIKAVNLIHQKMALLLGQT